MLRVALLAVLVSGLWLFAWAQTPVWTHTWNGPGTSDEIAYAGCRDSSANVYVCGSNERVMLVLAVGPDGSERWTWRWEPPLGGFSEPGDITFGADGNVYVCGQAMDEEGYVSFRVASLTAAGVERWRYEWSDPSVWDVEAQRIVWGGDGNVYACGSVEGEGTFKDVFVVSLTPAGAERWTFVYDGGFADFDEANDVIWGPDANVYVCGQVVVSDTGFIDFAVLSLTPAGALRWVHVYSPPVGGYDAAFRLMSDGRNVFAAGVCEPDYDVRDVCVVSVTPAGVRRWVYERQSGAGYSQAHDIVTGAGGRVFVSGRVDDGNGYSDGVVLALDSLGREDWEWRWSNGASSEDMLQSLVLTSDGSIAAAGYTYSGPGRADILAASLTQAGSQRWVRVIDGPASSYDGADDILAGPTGAVYVVGGITDSLSSSDFAVLRLSAAGSTEWVHTWDAGMRDGSDWANCAAFGPGGTAYVTGSGYWGMQSHELAVVAISAAGQESWSYRYSLPGGFGAEGYSVAVGSDDNVYVCGTGMDSVFSDVFLCLSLGPSGTERWTAEVGPGRAFSVGVGRDNNIYACGMLYDEASGVDMAVVSFTPAGSLRWSYRYDGGAQDYDFGWAIHCGPDSNIYVCGQTATADWRYVYTVLSLTPAGSLRWVWTDPVSQPSWSVSLAVGSGPDGNIYAGGFYEDTLADWLVATSFTPAGSLRWRYQSKVPGLGFSLACSRDSTVYVGGTLFSDAGYWDMAVLALSPSGESLWAGVFPSPGMYENANSIALGLDSLVYLAGKTDDDNDKQFYTLSCFDRRGQELWTWRRRGEVRWGVNSANWVTTRPDGSALVTGHTSEPETGSDMLTALFTPGIGVAGPAGADPARFRVPSHFRSALVCRLPRLDSPARLRLIDVTGRVIAQAQVLPGAREYVFPPALTARLAAGAYFVELVTAQSARTLRTVRVE
uniref:T9SS type A sorting domain-containing protein n=1 Tax=candidate division WOR-3 bacterium TaxID=2052148 RepID=A0A7C4CAF3_UNCW3